MLCNVTQYVLSDNFQNADHIKRQSSLQKRVRCLQNKVLLNVFNTGFRLKTLRCMLKCICKFSIRA